MEDLYMYCAAIAGTLLVGQLLLSLIGLGHHADLHDLPTAAVDVDTAADGFEHGGEWFAGMLSFRAIVAALTVFGLVGLGGEASPQFDRRQTFLIALVAGGSVLYGVGWLLRSLYQLKSEGTVQIERTVGQTGSVYLSIPGKKAGSGKVTVKVQGRTMQFGAMTPDEDLASGTPVVVLSVLTPGMVEVTKISETPTATEGEAHVQS